MTKLTIYGCQNIVKNKYFKWYCNIINKRVLNPLETSSYGEIHHILPRSLGGDNNKNNLVMLTAKEHYIVHLLLTKFMLPYTTDWVSVVYAFVCMNTLKSKHHKGNRYHNSRLYETAKINFSIANSIRMKKLWENEEYKNMMSLKHKKAWEDGTRDGQLEYLRNNSPFKNKNVHMKTIYNREINGNNVFAKNNPMKDKNKALEIASKRSGKKNYLTNMYIYYYSVDGGKTWIEVERGLTKSQMCKKYNWNPNALQDAISGINRNNARTYDIETHPLIKRELNTEFSNRKRRIRKYEN